MRCRFTRVLAAGFVAAMVLSSVSTSIAAKEDDATEARKVARIARAIRQDDSVNRKRRALRLLTQIGTVRALKVVDTLLDDEDVSDEAARAAVMIACPGEKYDEGLVGPGVAPVLRRVVRIVDDEDVKEKAAEHLETVVNTMRERAENLDEPFALIGSNEGAGGWRVVRELITPESVPKRATRGPLDE